jgi:MFS family permease
MSGLLREHDFRLLWFGQGISAMGSSVTAIVLPLIAVARLDATPFHVGLITAAGLAPWLVLGLPFGVWADRGRRRPLLIASDLGRAALLATIPIADLAGTMTIAHLGVVALLVGALSVLFDVSYPAYLPVVVDKSRLIDANGKLSATQSAAMMGGPGLGGSLLQLAGVAVAMLVDVLSFLISALTLSAIRAVEPVPQPVAAVRRRMRTELAQGLRFALSQPLVRALLAAGTVANFLLSGYTAVAVVFLYSTVGLGEAAIGALLAVATAGTVVGALLGPGGCAGGRGGNDLTAVRAGPDCERDRDHKQKAQQEGLAGTPPRALACHRHRLLGRPDVDPASSDVRDEHSGGYATD